MLNKVIRNFENTHKDPLAETVKNILGVGENDHPWLELHGDCSVFKNHIHFIFTDWMRQTKKVLKSNYDEVLPNEQYSINLKTNSDILTEPVQVEANGTFKNGFLHGLSFVKMSIGDFILDEYQAEFNKGNWKAKKTGKVKHDE